MLFFNIGKTPPPDFTILENTFGSIGNGNSQAPGMKEPKNDGVSDQSGTATLTALYHLILFTAIVVTLL